MAKTPPAVAVSITPAYQVLFIGALLFGWGVEVATIIRTYRSTYISTGTWLFQFSMWALPVLFLAISLIFSWKRYTAWLPKLCMGMFLTTIGVSLYSGLSLIEIYTRNHWFPRTFGPGDTSYWSAFGDTWTMMLVCLVLFTGIVFVLRKKL